MISVHDSSPSLAWLRSLTHQKNPPCYGIVQCPDGKSINLQDGHLEQYTLSSNQDGQWSFEFHFKTINEVSPKNWTTI